MRIRIMQPRCIDADLLILDKHSQECKIMLFEDDGIFLRPVPDDVNKCWVGADARPPQKKESPLLLI